MALDSQVYSFSDWQLGVKTEITTIGAAAANPVINTTLVNIDGPATFTPGTVIISDIRSGTPGQIAGVVDALVCPNGVYNEVSFSGIYDSTIGPILLPNLFASVVGTGPAGYGFAYNWTSPAGDHGGTVGTNISLGLSLIHPEPAKSISLIGVCLTNLTISADVEEENGRVKMSGTFGTGYKPVYDQTSPTTPTAYGSTFRYLTQATTTTQVASCDNCVIKSISLTVNNPAKYLGFQGTNGDPQLFFRGSPEAEVLLNVTAKVDANTASLPSVWSAGTTVTNEISNHETWASATNFGIKAAYCKILNVVESDVGAGYYDISMKCMAHTEGDVVELIA